MRYRVRVRGLRYPTDARILKRLAAGEKLPPSKLKLCEPHDVGEVIDDLPKQCAALLLWKGWVEEVDE